MKEINEFLKFRNLLSSKICFLIVLSFFSIISISFSQKQIEVGIDEQLDKHIPLGLTFKNSKGVDVKLSDILKRPTVLSFVYYDCPGICTPLLQGLSEVVEKTELQPGEDYQIITISMDHKETYEKARRWEASHIEELKKQIPEGAWQFLTGDSLSIQQITKSVGFRFKKDGSKDFLHPACLIVLAKDGKVTRYLFGTNFLPFDLKMAVAEASRGESRPTINKILQLCFKYDAKGRQYVLDLNKIIGAVMLLAVGIFATILIVSGRKKSKENS